MTTSIASLLLAASVLALAPHPAQAQQAPPAPAASAAAQTAPIAPADKPNAPAAPSVPVPPSPPSAPRLSDFDFDMDIDVDLDLDMEFWKEGAFKLQAKALKEQAKALEAEFKNKDIQVRIEKDVTREFGRQMAEMARQFPVPPVPPVPPKDPRQKPREPNRRRIPEGWVESTEPFSRAFPVVKGSTLMLSNISGNIQVTPGTADRIEVEALKRAWGPNAEQAKARLGDVVVETYTTANRVEVRVEQGMRRDGRGGDGRGIDVEFNVKVPGDAAVDLRTVSGDIRVTNVKGELRVEAVSGNVALEGTPRLSAVKTVNGGVTLTNTGADAQLSISTVNGDLVVQTLAARAIDVNTINGDVRMTGWSGDRAHIRSLDGDLDLQASLAKGGRYEIESHSGDVAIALAEQPGFELEAHTFNGRIRVDFPIKSEGPVRDSDRGPRTVRGTYGDGASSLRVQTFNGNLTISRK